MSRDSLVAARRHAPLSTAAVAAAVFATGIAAAGPFEADPSFGPDPNQVVTGHEAGGASFREGTTGRDGGADYDLPAERWDAAPVPARDTRRGAPTGTYGVPSPDRSRRTYEPARPLPAGSGRAPHATRVPPGRLKNPPGHAGRLGSMPSATGGRTVSRRPAGYSASAAVPTGRGQDGFGRTAGGERAVRPHPSRPSGGLGLFIDLGTSVRRSSDARPSADEPRRPDRASDGEGDDEDEKEDADEDD